MMEYWDEGPSKDPDCFTKGPVGHEIKNLQDNLQPFVQYEPFSDVQIPTPDEELLQNKTKT